MMNLANMMKQSQQVQKRLQDAQKDLAAAEIVAQVGNGSVTVICDGHGKFKSIKLTKEAINSENPASVDDDTVEMLEDLLSQALSEATKKATEQMEAKLKSVTGGISIPGLF